MRVELARMVSAPLADVTTGLAAQLAALQLDGADARPEVPAAILNQADHDAAVTQEGLHDWPLIVVAAEQPARYVLANVMGFRLDVPNCLVTVAYVTKDTAEPAQAWRDASYTLTAALKALLVGLFMPDKEANRTRGRTSILKLNGADIVPTAQQIEGGIVYGALVLDLHIRHLLT